ncbi:MAG: hypothetical protein GXX98_01305, partial [Planctomycetes bacterium]|nr:hypothetical protein [Planctomycetota bacterium]
MRSCRSWTMLFVTCAALALGSCADEGPESPVAVARWPRITPDYAGIIVPPNVAPLNFTIDEPGERYVVKVYSASGKPIEVATRTGQIVIPEKRWKDLLTANAGGELSVDVYVKTEDGQWNRYETIANAIAEDPIDSHLVYRFMTPSSYFPKPMQI